MLGKRPENLDDSIYIHPLAFVESKDIGNKTRVWAFAHIMQEAKVGSNCNVCEHVFIENGAIVGNNVTIKNQISIWDKVEINDNVFLGPNVVFTNDLIPRVEYRKENPELLPTLIKEGASIGANAVIVCGNQVGKYSFIAAGSVVINDVPDHTLVAGNPAVIMGKICKCAKTIFKEESVKKSCDFCQYILN
jgi:acetyltransferase-like isoleucine patch superfamily enzyme